MLKMLVLRRAAARHRVLDCQTCAEPLTKRQASTFRRHICRITEEDCQPTVWRQLSSLKNYSSLLPDGLAHFGSKVDPSSLAELNRRIRASNADGNFTISHGTSSGLTSSISIATCAVRKKEKNNGSGNVKHLDKEMTSKKRSSESMKCAGEVLLHSPAKRRLPLIFGHRKQCRIQIPKCLAESSTGSDKGFVLQPNAVKVQERSILQNEHLECQKPIENQVPGKNKVRFADANTILQQDTSIRNLKFSRKNGAACKSSKKSGCHNLELDARAQYGQFLTRCTNNRNIMIFQGIEFLITGFSRNREEEIEGLIQRHGGVVLLNIPSVKSRGKRSLESPLLQQPVVIKLKTAKFLYMVIPNQAALANYGTEEPIPRITTKRIFELVGIMLHGKCSFYAKFTTIIKHGGGHAFKTLQQLIRSLDIDNKKVSLGTVVTEYESRPSRHVRQCTMEKNIPVMPLSWIIESLYAGKLQPLPN